MLKMRIYIMVEKFKLEVMFWKSLVLDVKVLIYFVYRIVFLGMCFREMFL